MDTIILTSGMQRRVNVICISSRADSNLKNVHNHYIFAHTLHSSLEINVNSDDIKRLYLAKLYNTLLTGLPMGVGGHEYTETRYCQQRLARCNMWGYIITQAMSKRCPKLFGNIMTSSNRNIFRVTGPLWGKSTSHRWIPLTKASNAELSYIFFMRTWTNGWAKRPDAGAFNRYFAQVKAMISI